MVSLVGGETAHVAQQLRLQVEVFVAVFIRREYAGNGFSQVVGIGPVNVGLYILDLSSQDFLYDFVVEFALGEVIDEGKCLQRIKQLNGAVVEV